MVAAVLCCKGVKVFLDAVYCYLLYIRYKRNIACFKPGIYVQGKGGVRIEDMVVVTSEGYINLALLPKELIVL